MKISRDKVMPAFNSLVGLPYKFGTEEIGFSLSKLKHPPRKGIEKGLAPYYLDFLDALRNFLLFAPSKIDYLQSADKKHMNLEDVYTRTLDGELLHGYFLKEPQDTDKAVIYFHGNDLNISKWYSAATTLQKHIPANFLIVDYRGYGKSTGIPSFQGLILDGLATYNHLIQRGFKTNNISIYGRSMGGAVALELASRVNVRSVVVQSSITTFRDLIKAHFPYIPSFLIKNDLFNLQKLIKKVHAPILISHGDKDKVSPLKFSYKLYELANEPKKLIILNNATHRRLTSFFTEEYFNTLRELFL